MEELTYNSVTKKDIDLLVEFYLSTTWSFHADPDPSEEELNQRFKDKEFFNDRDVFWIEKQGKKLGILILSDVSDTIPLFYDIRLLEAARGRGIGEKAVKWAVAYLFQTFKQTIRIEAYTRVDNFAMRKTFTKSGFLKEGYLRNAWENDDGTVVDSMCYGIIRQDWLSGKTTTYIMDDVPY